MAGGCGHMVRGGLVTWQEGGCGYKARGGCGHMTGRCGLMSQEGVVTWQGVWSQGKGRVWSHGKEEGVAIIWQGCVITLTLSPLATQYTLS